MAESESTLTQDEYFDEDSALSSQNSQREAPLLQNQFGSSSRHDASNDAIVAPARPGNFQNNGNSFFSNPSQRNALIQSLPDHSQSISNAPLFPNNSGEAPANQASDELRPQRVERLIGNNSSAERLQDPMIRHAQEYYQQQANQQQSGISRFLRAIEQKRMLLRTNFFCTSWIILFDFFSLLVLPFKDEFGNDLIIEQNRTKASYIMVRETLFFASVLLICLVMRMRAKFPDFYSSELHHNPEFVGLDMDGRFVFLDLSSNSNPNSRQNARKLAKIFHMKLKRNKVLNPNVELESQLSNALRQWNDPVNHESPRR
mmetsp:Transcript_12767/g.21565  ORF Transcript_12767/g.21565 Transcript_12767/m.21565 type:complete len:316 (-) Transcript_12767:346-1293(-)